MFEGFIKSHITSKNEKKIIYFKNFNSLDKSKKTLIFNYGLVCSHEHYRYQIDFFKSNFNIVAHDYRGHYESESEADLSDVTFSNICEDTVSILTQENIQSCILIGHSMGVNISLEIANLCPNMIESMVLISGTAQPVFGTMFNSNIVEHISPILKIIFKKFPNAVDNFWKHTKHNPLIKRIVHKGGFNMETVSDEFIDIYLTKINELGPQLFIRLLEQMNNHETLNKLSKIKTKTLIIGGDHDKVIPNYNQRLLHEKITNSELFIIKNGSHVPQVDFPNFVNRRVELFIS